MDGICVINIPENIECLSKEIAYIIILEYMIFAFYCLHFYLKKNVRLFYISKNALKKMFLFSWFRMVNIPGNKIKSVSSRRVCKCIQDWS